MSLDAGGAPPASARRPPRSAVRLAGEGIVLRPYRSTDEPLLAAAFEDPLTRCWNPLAAGLDVSGWWRRRTDWTGGTHASFAVADAGDDRLLGDVSLHEIDVEHAHAEVGYTVLPGERGRGVARRAVRAATCYAFEELRLFRVQLYHGLENAASCRVALACGYRIEGTLRQSYVYGDGRRHDEHLHARLATDP